MAGKRGATSDLNHDNWDRDEEFEEAGTFRKASDEVLKKRVIKTARRRAPINTTPTDSGEKKNIFGGFTAFAKPPANPASAFSFIQKDQNGADPPPENGDYLGKLKGLNESVSRWISRHVDENPFLDLKPVFVDYERYFKEIEMSKVSAEQRKELSGFSFKKAEEFSFGAPKKAEFSFGPKTDAQKKSEEAPKFVFGSSEGKSEKFSFGTAPAAQFAPPSSTPFTFNNVSKPQEEESKQEDNEDEPPKVEFTPVVEEDNIYTIRCKVFVKKDGTFADRGVGNLFLKPIPSTGKVQLIVRADTNLGNLLLNFVLSEGVPLQRLGKKDVMVCCVPMPESKPPPVAVLLRVKSGEEADGLLQTLEKHKK